MNNSAILILAIAGTSLIQADPPCCLLKAISTEASATTIQITLTNIGDQPVAVQLAAVFDSYQIDAQSSDGQEPSRSTFGEALKREGLLAGFGRRRQVLEKGQSLSQVFDLSAIWTFREGIYTIRISRQLVVQGHVFPLSSEVELLIPHESVGEEACQPAPQSGGPLKGEDARVKSDHLQRALAARIEFLQAAKTHNVSSAFRDTLIGAHLSGGISLTNDGASQPVCIVKGESVRVSIENIQATSSHLKIDGQSDLVNVLDDRTSDFLETKIARLELPSARWAVDGALEAILTSPEMQSRKSSLALHDAGIMRPPMTPKMKQWVDSEGFLILEKVTARQALNSIVEKLDSATWIYTEWATGKDKRAFKIELMYGSVRKN